MISDDTAHYIVTCLLCNVTSFTNCVWALSGAKYLKFCLLTKVHRWQWASSDIHILAINCSSVSNFASNAVQKTALLLVIWFQLLDDRKFVWMELKVKLYYAVHTCSCRYDDWRLTECFGLLSTVAWTVCMLSVFEYCVVDLFVSASRSNLFRYFKTQVCTACANGTCACRGSWQWSQN